MMGTAKYLSPEQVRGKRLDGRADLYSLGLVLYECLAGRVPFLGETDADTALARLQRDPTDLAQLRATLPTELVVVVHRLLARNPNNRPATGADLAASLKRAAHTGPPVVDPTGDSTASDHDSHDTTAPPSEKPTLASRWRAAPAIAAAAGPAAPTIPGEIAPAPVDPTPPTRAPRGEPARELADRRAPSAIVVGGIVVVALALIAVLVASLRFGSDDTALTTTALPSATTADTPEGTTPGAPPPSVAASAPLVAEPASISTITAFDPEGDGTENDGDAVLAVADGDPTTFWRTVCYEDRFMGAKRGVGLVVSFDAPMQEALSVDVQSAPYQLQFFASDAESAPATIDDWGPELGTRAFAAEPGTVVSATPSAPARHMLVLLNELGADDTCTGANPWRGRLGDIAPAG